MGFCLTQNATGSSFVMKLQLGSIRKGCVIDLMGSLGFGMGILTGCWHLAAGRFFREKEVFFRTSLGKS